MFCSREQTADVLEVYLLSLLLGFKGRYSVAGRGELRALINGSDGYVDSIVVDQDVNLVLPRDNLPHFANHSCEPNTFARIVAGRIFYFSKRRIERGEEVTVDYKYGADLDPIPCHCGAATCRGTMNLPRVVPPRNARQRSTGR